MKKINIILITIIFVSTAFIQYFIYKKNQPYEPEPCLEKVISISKYNEKEECYYPEQKVEFLSSLDQQFVTLICRCPITK